MQQGFIKNQTHLAIGLISLVVCARILPHPVNMTPMVTVCLWLGWYYTPKQAVFFALVGYLLSDLVLSWLFSYSFFGHWLGFHVIAYTIITLGLGRQVKVGKLRNYFLAFNGGFLFWLISNFGVWVAGTGYALTQQGFVQCYINALPFLVYALIGDLFWMMILSRFVKRWLHLNGESHQRQSLQYENLAVLNQCELVRNRCFQVLK